MDHLKEAKLSHDIGNALERLRIIHDIIKKKKFNFISKDELKEDINKNTQEIKDSLLQLLNED